MESLDTNLSVLFQWLLRATFEGSLLACLILAIKLALRERLPARWHYCLWLILLVRLSLPWAPQSHLSIYNLVPRPFSSHHTVPAPADGARSDTVGAKPGTVSQEKGTVPALPGTQDKSLQRGQDGAAVSAPPVGALRQSDGAAPAMGRRPFAESVASVTPWLWLGGCLVLGGYILLRAFGLWWAVRSERPVTDQQILDLLEDCKMQMRVRTIVGVVVTDKVRTPALFGFVRPRILLPQGLIETLGLDELHYVFLHELAHLKRRDIYLAWLVCLLQVLHWFNPLIWLAFRRMRADQEVAADALALSAAGTEESRRYGQTIVSLLERFSRPQYLPSLAGILENPSHIERRIQMITRFRSNSRPWSVLGVGVMVVLGTVSMIDPTRGTVSASSAPQGKAPMTMRMVQKEVQDEVSTSPDGRYLCNCGTWFGTGGITIRELATGEQRTVKPTKAVPEEEDPQYPVMSPDNRIVAYAAGRPGQGVDVCLIGVDGSGQRVLCHDLVRPVQWFPDGSRLLGLRWLWPKGAETDVQIVSISIGDGSVQPIKTLTGDIFRTRIRLSPDAKTVAYELGSNDDPNHWYGDVSAYDSKRHDLFAIDIDSKRETPLVVHAADDRLLDWTPDGRHILFVSDRTGSWSAWLLPVAKGQAQGAPELAARTMGEIKSVGFAENSAYYYRIRYSTGGIYMATTNLSTGQLLSGPVQEADGASPAWSPDGKYLAYCQEVKKPSESRVIRIRSLATGQERELPNKLTMFRCLRWSPDGRSLIASDLVDFGGTKPEDMLQTRVYRFDVATGETTLLLDNKKSQVDMAELSPDGKTLY